MSAHQALAHRLEARTLLLGEVEEAELLAREDLRVLADQVLDLGLGLGVELLIVEDEHGVLVHPGMDRLDVGGGERPREVDTVDFSGETGTDLASRDGHRRQPPRNRLSPAAHTGGWLGTAESSERDASSSPGYHRDLARRERWGSSHACSRRSTTAFRGTRRIPTDRARGREF